MLVYNCDETGISLVRESCSRDGTENNVLTSAEKGKPHTLLAHVVASSHVLPYLQKRHVLNAMEGAVSNTLLMAIERVNSKVPVISRPYPLARLLLFLQDGHVLHTSIVLELAPTNQAHILLYFPAHTAHVLQPLDVSVFLKLTLYQVHTSAFRIGVSGHVLVSDQRECGGV